MSAMTPIEFNFDMSTADAVADKLDLYIDCGGTYGWQRLGPFDDESSIDSEKEKYEKKFDGKDWLIKYLSEGHTLKGNLLNGGNPYAIAIAFGRDPAVAVDESDPDEIKLDLSNLPSSPPTFKMKALGMKENGKYFVWEFFKAQITTTSISMAFKKGEICMLPIEITALEDTTILTGPNRVQYRAQRAA